MGKHHDAGQADGAKGYGNANPPHGHFEELVSFGKTLEEVQADNREYWAAYNNALSQSK